MTFKKVAFYGVLFAFVTPSISAWAAPGYVSVDEPSLPAPVRAAAERTLEVWAPAGIYAEHPISEYAALEDMLAQKLTSNVNAASRQDFAAMPVVH